jgi:ribosome biogenesis GTPase A
VTKGKQWIKLNKNLELLDTPGILWPKFEDQAVGMKLAFIGSMNDEVIIIEELACDLLTLLREVAPESIPARYHVEWKERPVDTLLEIGRQRGCMLKGEEIDIKKAGAIVADDFRSGRLGRITLERPAGEKGMVNPS